MDASSWLSLLGFIAACFLAAMTGAFFRPGDWYERLRNLSAAPPNRLFAPVWTVLYVMIAFSGWLVWREAGFAGAALPLTIYALQLILNAAWTPRSSACTGPISASSISCSSGSRSSPLSRFSGRSTWYKPLCCSWHLYLAWVTFATALNLAIWRLNPPAAQG